MNEPLVCAIMLVNGREQMVKRAVESFRAQSYANKRLLVLDTGTPPVNVEWGDEVVFHAPSFGTEKATIGKLRNFAAGYMLEADILCHFDSDDQSHPQRIAEQSALLQASGADCVGYYEAPFWDTRNYIDVIKRSGHRSFTMDYLDKRNNPHGQAWLYTELTRRIPLGASLCYWRSAWERRPFDDVNHGEDARFTQGLRNVAVSAIGSPVVAEPHPPDEDCEPRLICGVHGGNTSHGYDFSKRSCGFKRAPELDAICSERMKL